MTATKGKGPVFDPGLCRCCGNMKKCRVLNLEYESFGQKEIYSDMIMDCFGLLVSFPLNNYNYSRKTRVQYTFLLHINFWTV